jgi:hypothetical protein
MISDNMWFNRIGEINTESVLMRSFTSLGITLLLLVDSDINFLEHDEWIDLLQLTVDYCTQERDLRGYDDGIGWLHSAAHVADVLNALANHPNYCREHNKYILKAINMVMENAVEIFQYEEDERLSRVITSLFGNNHLTLEELLMWFEQANIDLTPYLLGMRKRVNWKLLFRSCFSQLSKRKLYHNSIDNTLLTNIKNKFENPYL